MTVAPLDQARALGETAGLVSSRGGFVPMRRPGPLAALPRLVLLCGLVAATGGLAACAHERPSPVGTNWVRPPGSQMPVCS
jgi:hypothetical protein